MFTYKSACFEKFYILKVHQIWDEVLKCHKKKKQYVCVTFQFRPIQFSIVLVSSQNSSEEKTKHNNSNCFISGVNFMNAMLVSVFITPTRYPGPWVPEVLFCFCENRRGSGEAATTTHNASRELLRTVYAVNFTFDI